MQLISVSPLQFSQSINGLEHQPIFTNSNCNKNPSYTKLNLS